MNPILTGSHVSVVKKHKALERRTPGLYKLEGQGKEMVALCSKTYILQEGEQTKMSCKGINKKEVIDPMQKFHQVLSTHHSVSGTNRGFRVRDNTMFTYEQKKNGFGYFYCKRKVMADGVSTKTPKPQNPKTPKPHVFYNLMNHL